MEAGWKLYFKIILNIINDISLLLTTHGLLYKITLLYAAYTFRGPSPFSSLDISKAVYDREEKKREEKRRNFTNKIVEKPRWNSY